MYRNYKQFIDRDLFFDPEGDHGVGHTKRVLYLAQSISRKYELTDI